jgi:hypothetical protein
MFRIEQDSAEYSTGRHNRLIYTIRDSKQPMTRLAKLKKLSRIALKPQILTQRAKYLFIFSHMRSRSSVLSHVLGTNAEIYGYRELLTSYQTPLSLLKMRAVLFSELGGELKDKYLLDKILHDYPVSESVYQIAQPKVLFLLREPESTLKSIVRMGQLTGEKQYADPILAGDYYCNRLLSLEDCAREYGKGGLFIESIALINRTEDTLERLTKWLNLQNPLSKRYSFFPKTGSASYGDPSANIKAGVIEKTIPTHDVYIPEDVLKRCETSHLNCRDVLLKHVL